MRGDKDKHDFSSNNGSREWGHGIVFDGGRNLEADHLLLTNVTGDAAHSDPPPFDFAEILVDQTKIEGLEVEPLRQQIEESYKERLY